MWNKITDMNWMDQIQNQQSPSGMNWYHRVYCEAAAALHKPACSLSKDYWALVMLSARKTWLFSEQKNKKLIFVYLFRCDDADILFYWTKNCIFWYIYVLRITAIDGEQGLSSAKRSKNHCKSGPFVFVLCFLGADRH